MDEYCNNRNRADYLIKITKSYFYKNNLLEAGEVQKYINKTKIKLNIKNRNRSFE